MSVAIGDTRTIKELHTRGQLGARAAAQTRISGLIFGHKAGIVAVRAGFYADAFGGDGVYVAAADDITVPTANGAVGSDPGVGLEGRHHSFDLFKNGGSGEVRESVA